MNVMFQRASAAAAAAPHLVAPTGFFFSSRIAAILYTVGPYFDMALLRVVRLLLPTARTRT